MSLVKKVANKLISRSDAANLLNVSIWTIERYEAGFKAKAVQFFIRQH